jgi:hypothetical protein
MLKANITYIIAEQLLPLPFITVHLLVLFYELLRFNEQVQYAKRVTRLLTDSRHTYFSCCTIFQYYIHSSIVCFSVIQNPGFWFPYFYVHVCVYSLFMLLTSNHKKKNAYLLNVFIVYLWENNKKKILTNM